MKKGLLSICFLCVLAAGAAGEEEKVSLRVNLEKGKQYEFKRSLERVTRGGAEGRQSVENYIELTAEVEVTEGSGAGGAWLKYTYRAAKTRNAGPNRKVEFDSTKETASVPMEALGLVLMLHESFYFNVRADGTIEQINGLSAISSAARGKLPNVRGREQVLEALEENLREADIRQELKQFFGPWLGRELAVGESWGEQMGEGTGALSLTHNLWTLKDMRGGAALIELVVAVEPNRDIEPIPLRGVLVKRQISGEGMGAIEVDIQSGLLIRSELNQKTTEVLELAERGAYRRRESPFVPVETTSKLSLSVKELE